MSRSAIHAAFSLDGVCIEAARKTLASLNQNSFRVRFAAESDNLAVFA